MTLRIGFDLDGVLADLAAAYRAVDLRLFGDAGVEDEAPESFGDDGETPLGSGDEKQDDMARGAVKHLREQRQRHLAVWHAIEATHDFWTTLRPLEEGLVARLAEAATRHRWEVLFITQRPDTVGETAQRQTQRWLVAYGFDLPAVVIARGGRGALADALALDYLVDDTAKNCVDVVADSDTRVILVNRTGDPTVAASARRLGVAVVSSASGALDILEQATAARTNPTLFNRLARLVGWRWEVKSEK